MYNILICSMPLNSLIAYIIFIIAMPCGVWGLVLVLKIGFATKNMIVKIYTKTIMINNKLFEKLRAYFILIIKIYQ